MPNELTAQFELQLLDQMSRPLQKILQQIGDVTQRLSGIAGATSGSDAVNRSLSDAERTTNQLNAAMQAVTGTSGGLSEALGATAGAGEAASGGLGAVIEEMTALDERAASSIGLLGRLKESLSGVGGAGPESGIRGRLHGFHEHWDKAQARGFGALMGGFELLEPAEEAAEYDNTIRHVGIGLEIHGGGLDQYVASEKVKINELARATGQRSGELAEALGFFSREGFRGNELESSLATTAKISTAYNAKPESVARSAFAMKENLGIDDTHLQGALASFAIAGKLADLPFEKIAPLLPELAASAGNIGVKGRSGVDDLAAAIAVIRKSTGNDGEAFTRGAAFLQTVTSKHGLKNWKNVFGENLFTFEQQARQRGIDPMIAVIDKIKGAVDRAPNKEMVLSQLFGNQYDTGAIRAILNNWSQFDDIHKKVSAADQSVIDRDYADGRKSGLISVQSFEDSLKQLLRRIGDDFTPILNKLTYGINGVNQGLEWMDQHMTGLSTVLIGGVGVIIAVTTVAGALGAVAGVVGAGFSLLGVVIEAVASPVVAVVVGVVSLSAGLYALLTHIEQVGAFFDRLGNNIAAFIDRIIHALPQSWHNIVEGWNARPRLDPSHVGPDGKPRRALTPDEIQARFARQFEQKHPQQAVIQAVQNTALTRVQKSITHQKQNSILHNAYQVVTNNHQNKTLNNIQKHATNGVAAQSGKTAELVRPVPAALAQPALSVQKQETVVRLKVEAAPGLKVEATHADSHAPVQIDYGVMMGRP